MKSASGTVLLLLSTSVFADWKFSGNVAPYFQQIMVDPSPISPRQKSGVSASLNLENKMSSKWRFRSDVWFRTDFFAKDAQETFQYIPKNVHFQYRSREFTFRGGFQTMQIDGPDIINPADIVHSKNWVDPTTPVTQSSLGLSFSQEKGDWNWEVLYVPRQTPALLPGAHSPWLPRKNRLPIESEDTEIRIPNDVEYQYLGAKILNNALNHNVTLKIQRKTDAIETQFLYYNGLSNAPYVLTRVTGTLLSVNPDVIAVSSPVRLQPLYYRQHALAGTFNLPLGSWAVHGGINWMKPQGHDVRTPSESSLGVLGVEKSFETGLGMVTTVVDYVRQELQNDNQISFLRSIFQNALAAGVRVPIGEETQVFAGGIYDLTGASSLYRASVSRRVTSSLSVEGQAQFLQGPSKT
ncbi:MAG: hypothetical protein ACJ76H_08270, partial [Bacteriovoracaceae bacterium]